MIRLRVIRPMRHARRTLLAGILLSLGSCSESTAPKPPAALPPPAAVTITEPVPAPPAPSLAGPARSATGNDVVFVSFPPATFPTATQVRITNGVTSVTAIPVDGGLDPVPVSAAVGDTIQLEITYADGSVSRYAAAAPAVRRPRIVRTFPPRNRADLPLNSIIIIVFSEPMDPASTDSTTLYLRSASGLVRATTLPAADGLRIELHPETALPAGDTLTLYVTPGLTDLAGDSLEQAEAITFVTSDAPPAPTGEEFLATRISAGGHRTCAVTQEGTLYCWGAAVLVNWLPSLVPSRTPELVLSQELLVGVATNDWLTCATSAGAQRPFCGGAVEISPGGYLSMGVAVGSARGAVPGPVATSEVVVLTASGRHTCGLTASGSLLCWGANESGQLAMGYTFFASSFLRNDGNHTSVDITPVSAGGGRAFRAAAAGHAHTCAVTDAGEIYCWGESGSGQLGVAGAGSCALSGCGPVGQRSFVEVAAGRAHSCALDAVGAAWCWGTPIGGWGQSSETPVLAGAGPFSRIAAGADHTCALDGGGLAWCWGDNSHGQLGDGSFMLQAAPTAVSGGHSFAEITAGNAHTCARTPTHQVYCWGDNTWGQLGPALEGRGTPGLVTQY